MLLLLSSSKNEIEDEEDVIEEVKIKRIFLFLGVEECRTIYREGSQLSSSSNPV